MISTEIAERAEQLIDEVARRRTFAIISHPDAGKTTLTEKLLLYAGAVDQAGSVRSRKNQRHATSDWMAMEQERGISITSTVLQFDHEGYRFNLLDTPGHQDFSEDTYRTLMAVDSAIMVLDRGKGIEPQTLKLFEVCRLRQIPILTFINKLDHEGRDPLDLLDEIERVLGVRAVPMNWPIGNQYGFQGVYDLERRQVLLFQRTTGGQYRAPVQLRDSDDPLLAELLGEAAFERLNEDVALLREAGGTFDREAFLAGKMTPVFFGSALNNFGVEPFLGALMHLAPSPRPRMSSLGLIQPASAGFTGFVFKIQANMDPNHRDRMAFLRVCSGHFQKDMQVYHSRLGRKVRMARPHRLFARDRETIDEAFPGDVIGLSNPGLFRIGDTVCSDDILTLDAVPRFSPERFAIIRNQHVAKYKQFAKGLEQLVEEGVIQILYAAGSLVREPILAAVGDLQFDVVQARMQGEYGVETALERLSYTCARWVEGDGETLAAATWPRHTLRTYDEEERLVVLFGTEWDLNYCREKNPRVAFKDHA